jgi:hypothetical protein
VIIKLERSGGLAGTSMSVEISAKDLPPKLIDTAKKIMTGPKISLPPKTSRRGPTDYYCYLISIQDGVNTRVVECYEYALKEELKKLIRFIEKSSKKKMTDK